MVMKTPPLHSALLFFNPGLQLPDSGYMQRGRPRYSGVEKVKHNGFCVLSRARARVLPSTPVKINNSQGQRTDPQLRL